MGSAGKGEEKKLVSVHCSTRVLLIFFSFSGSSFRILGASKEGQALLHSPHPIMNLKR